VIDTTVASGAVVEVTTVVVEVVGAVVVVAAVVVVVVERVVVVGTVVGGVVPVGPPAQAANKTRMLPRIQGMKKLLLVLIVVGLVVVAIRLLGSEGDSTA
jgi:hypothetical protein